MTCIMVKKWKKNDLCLTSWIQDGKPVFGVSKWTGKGWKPILDDGGKQALFFDRSDDRNDYIKALTKKSRGGESS